MEILASLVKRNVSGKGESTPDLPDLADLLGGNHQSSRAEPHAKSRRPQSTDQMARSLEDLLGVGDSSTNSSRTNQAPSSPFGESSRPVQTDTNEALIRIMLAAARSDGHLDASEKESIFQQLGKVSDSELEFLRRQFESTADVRQLAWEVPLGLEQAAYQAAVLSMKIDERSEVDFLASLQHGLRLSPKWCNEIHQRYGKPTIFRV